MHKFLFLLTAVLFMSCSNHADEHAEHDHSADSTEHVHEHDGQSAALQLNNGAKWKADEVTKKNVAALSSLMNDSANQDETNKETFVKNFNNQLNTLVQECKMSGPDHDALHVWLEKVIADVKQVKEGSDFNADFANLKTDVAEFYNYFE